jgi:hypothetical protein
MSSFWLDESTDRRYYEGRAFSYGEINYTKAGAVSTTFADLGFVQVTVASTPDGRFYYFDGPNDDGSWNVTEKRLEDEPAVDGNGDPVLGPDGTQVINYGLKSGYLTQQKQTAGSLLAQSDWYVVREAETGTAVPAEITTYRAAVRTTCDSREASIAAVTTVEELEALVKAPAEVLADPTDPESGLVENPEAHLEPWPEQE